MTETIVVILVSLAMLVALFAGTRYVLHLIKYNTQINRLLTLCFTCFGYGIIYDCARTLSFLILGGVIETLDSLGFFLKIFFLFVGISLLFRIILLLSRQGGHPVKHESTFRFLYIFIIGVLTILNIYFYRVADIDEIGIYVYQVHPLSNLIIIIFYFPLFIFIVLQFRNLSQEMKDQHFKNKTILLAILVALLVVERYLNIIYYSSILNYLYSNSVFVLMIDFCFIIVIMLMFAIVVFIKNPNILENISTYFCVKSVHIIKLEGGQTLFSYNFQASESKSIFTSDQLLLGGFVQALSTGLTLGLSLNGKIETVKIGNAAVLFGHGTYVFGIVFVTEISPNLSQKLRTFVERFEEQYKTELDNWTGSLSIFNTKELETLVNKIFL